MATPRSILVDPDVPLHYHVTSRCVQKAWLLGPDPATGQMFEHRRQWLIDRFKHLGKYFAIEICAYAIMSNHFHLVIYLDPSAPDSWSDTEVALRWVSAFPAKTNGAVDPGMQQLEYEELLDDQTALAKARRKLSSLSCFMQHLKQPIAQRANREAGVDGNFWASRFYSGALLDEQAVMATMAYVDLNPIRANITNQIGKSVDTSVFERLKHAKHNPDKLEEYLAPIVSGLDKIDESRAPNHRPTVTLSAYLEHLDYIRRSLMPIKRPLHFPRKINRWVSHVQTLRKKQRAYGTLQNLQEWLEQRHLRPLETPMA